MNLIKKNSPNHYNGRNGWKADIIVFHQTGGASVTPALNWYLNPGAQCSPHFVIDTNGDVYQLVELDNAAWCNGTNTTAGHKLYYGSALSEIVRQRKTNANYYTYSIEFVHCQWGNINSAQITAAVDLIKTVIIPHMRKCGVTPQIDRKHFIGHSDVTPISRPNGSCPGKRFPYDEMISRVLGKTPAVTAEQGAAFKVGDKVTIKETAATYAGVSTKIPAGFKGSAKIYTVNKVMSDRVLLKELHSWVGNKDVVLSQNGI